MATILEQYREMQSKMRSQVSQKSLPLGDVLILQEVNYRICILETFSALCQTAPITTDTNAMGFHYQIVDAYVRFVLNERRFGLKTDAEGQKKRETAYASFEKVVQDGRRRFSGFRANNAQEYKASVGKYIMSILSVWLQCRNTYINV